MNILVTYRVMAFMAVIEQAGLPALMAHLRIDGATYDAIPKNGGVVMPLSQEGFMRTNNRRFQTFRSPCS